MKNTYDLIVYKGLTANTINDLNRGQLRQICGLINNRYEIWEWVYDEKGKVIEKNFYNSYSDFIQVRV